MAFFPAPLSRSPQEEKYYLNELTALSSRRIALECAHAFKHTIVLQKVVESLVTMDPNAGRAPAAMKPTSPKDVSDMLESIAKVVGTVTGKGSDEAKH